MPADKPTTRAAPPLPPAREPTMEMAEAARIVSRQHNPPLLPDCKELWAAEVVWRAMYDAPLPTPTADDAGARERILEAQIAHLESRLAAVDVLVGDGFAESVHAALDRLGAPRKSASGSVTFGIVGRIDALAKPVPAEVAGMVERWRAMLNDLRDSQGVPDDHRVEVGFDKLCDVLFYGHEAAALITRLARGQTYGEGIEAAAKVAEGFNNFSYVQRAGDDQWEPGSPYDRGAKSAADKIAAAIRALAKPSVNMGD